MPYNGENLVGGAANGLQFADGDSAGGGEIEVAKALNHPTRRAQLSVNGRKGWLFGSGQGV